MPRYEVTKTITVDTDSPEEAGVAFFRALDIDPGPWGDTVSVESLDDGSRTLVTVRREPEDEVDVLDFDTTAA